MSLTDHSIKPRIETVTANNKKDARKSLTDHSIKPRIETSAYPV